MSKAPVGIEFLETMSGGFALGATDPELGAIKGRLEGSSFTNDNKIVIADLDAFLANDDHPAELGVNLDFTPFGDGIASAPGVFNLFKPGGEHGVKLMVYRFGFTFDSQPYYFEGKKYIHDGSSVVKLWHESTHLYSRLFRGQDDSGEIAGAGVLSIGVRGVYNLVKSMKVTNASSRVQEVEALGRFGEFFFGELWDAYKSHLGL